MRLVPGRHLDSSRSSPRFHGFNLILGEPIPFIKRRLDTCQVVGLYWTTQSISNAEKTLLSPVLLYENQVEAFLPSAPYICFLSKLLMCLKRVLIYILNDKISQTKE